MKAKKYIKLFLLIALVFIIFHFLVWTFFTKYSLGADKGFYIGDAGRMSYQKNSIDLKKDEITLPRKHLNFNHNEKNVDVLTIGDSFSNGMARGLNPFYQDYIASLYNLKVMNIERPSSGPTFSTILKLHKLGILRKMNVKYIILEKVQRNLKSFGGVNEKIDIESDFLEKISLPKYPRDFEHLFINRLNYNGLIYNILYNFDEKAFFSKIYKFKLNKDFFTVKASNYLLSYDKDIKNIKNLDIKNIKIINKKLNDLQDILDKDGIKLVFMPAVDKYDLYSKYIINNKYPKSIFFEEFRKLEKNYIFIDTKKILSNKLLKGEKDIYYADDTHWSYKGSESIVKSMKWNLNENFNRTK